MHLLSGHSSLLLWLIISFNKYMLGTYLVLQTPFQVWQAGIWDSLISGGTECSSGTISK